MTDEPPLQPIPRFRGDAPGLHAAARDSAERLRRAGLALVGPAWLSEPLLALGDRLTAGWARRADLPYRDEIAAIAAAHGRPGVWLLNLSYEWGCTSGVVEGPAGPRLVRTLDWPQRLLGAELSALEASGPAGPWVSLTWPGYVGCITGLAPGRFAVAVNQAPMRRRGFGLAIDWALNRISLLARGRGAAPTLLARETLDRDDDYAAAKRRLAETPLALPAIFILAGARPGEGCVIERLEDRARISEGPACVTNHWLGEWPGRERSWESPRRLADMRALIAAGAGFEPADWDPSWLRFPILNPDTRLAALAEPATGRLVAQGFEAGAAATLRTTLDHPPLAA